MRILLNSGAYADKGQCSLHGLTAVQGAAKGGHVDTPKLLLHHKASFNGPPAAQNELSCASGFSIRQNPLNKVTDINQAPSVDGGVTALQVVTIGVYLDVMGLLLQKESSSENLPAWSGGLTAVQASADGGHLDAVELLVESGADINQGPRTPEVIRRCRQRPSAPVPMQ